MSCTDILLDVKQMCFKIVDQSMAYQRRKYNVLGHSISFPVILPLPSRYLIYTCFYFTNWMKTAAFYPISILFFFAYSCPRNPVLVYLCTIINSTRLFELRVSFYNVFMYHAHYRPSETIQSTETFHETVRGNSLYCARVSQISRRPEALWKRIPFAFCTINYVV